MTIPRLQALTAHWRQFPPVHITLASFVGAGSKEPAPAQTSNQQPDPQQSDDLAELLGMLSPG